MLVGRSQSFRPHITRRTPPYPVPQIAGISLPIVLDVQYGVGMYSAVTGGTAVTADAAAAKRWEDQSGNGFHLTQATTGSTPVLDAIKSLMVCGNTLDGAPHFYSCSIPIDRQNFSYVVFGEPVSNRQSMNLTNTTRYHLFTNNAADSLNILVDGTTGFMGAYAGGDHATSLIPTTTSPTVYAWTGSASALTCYNEDSSAAASALSAGSVTVTSILGGGSTTGAVMFAVKRLIIFAGTLSAGDYAALLALGRASYGIPASRSGQLVTPGDSITQGYQNPEGRNWPSLLTLPTGTRVHNTAQSGITLASLYAGRATFEDLLLLGGGQKNVMALHAGINDVRPPDSLTGAQLYTIYSNYVTDAIAAGWKVIAVTLLPATSYTGPVGDFNTLLKASNGAGAQYFVDMTGDAGLQDPTSGYYADGIHLNGSGAAQFALLMQGAVSAAFASSNAGVLGVGEYGAGSVASVAALSGQILVGPWQTVDRRQYEIKVQARGTTTFNLNYEFSTDKGATWYVGEQVAAASVSIDDGANYAKEAHLHVNVGYWWRVSVYNTDTVNTLAVACEWRFHEH